MKKKALAALMFVMMFATVLTGCGKKNEGERERRTRTAEEKSVSVEEIVDGIIAYEMSSFDAEAKVDMNLGMSVLGTDATIDMKMNMTGTSENVYNDEETKAHMKGDMQMHISDSTGALNQDQSMELESYIQGGDTYSWTSEDGEWRSMHVEGNTGREFQTVLKDALKKEVRANAKYVGEDTIAGEKVYVLTYSGTGEDFRVLFEEVGKSVDSNVMLEDLGVDVAVIYQALKFDAVIYASVEDYHLVGLSVDFSKTNIDDILTAAGITKEMLMGAEIKLNTMKVEAIYTNVNKASVGEIPEEIIEATYVDPSHDIEKEEPEVENMIEEETVEEEN